MKASFVSSSAISQALRYSMLRTQNDLVQAQKEAATGKLADSGLVLGARTAQAVSFARGNGYERMRLWTHTNQESARKVYAAAGFAIVETMPENNFGKELNGEIWEMQF